MKRLLLTIAMIFALIPMCNSASAQDKGAFRIGFHTGYYFRAKAYSVGIYARYSIADWLNVEPGVNYMCKEKSTVDVYCDLQVPLEVATYWYVYPIVGISAHDISAHSGTVDGWAGGLNLGLGVSYELNDRWSVNAQGKWMGRLPRKFKSAVITQVGISYNF